MPKHNHIKEKKETLTFKVDAVIAGQFNVIVEKEGYTRSHVLRDFVKRYVVLKGDLVSIDDSGSK